MTARRASQEREGLVDRQVEARRKDAFRLLDDDARVPARFEAVRSGGRLTAA
jgi:hypothetical protein